jgi:hypothetical protein
MAYRASIVALSMLPSPMNVPRIDYLHDWRQVAGRSDHSPLLATLDW